MQEWGCNAAAVSVIAGLKLPFLAKESMHKDWILSCEREEGRIKLNKSRREGEPKKYLFCNILDLSPSVNIKNE